MLILVVDMFFLTLDLMQKIQKALHCATLSPKITKNQALCSCNSLEVIFSRRENCRFIYDRQNLPNVKTFYCFVVRKALKTLKRVKILLFLIKRNRKSSAKIQ